MQEDHNLLVDYEKAMSDLLEEMRQLHSANFSLGEVVERLARIQSAYATAGKALLSVAERTSATIKSIDSLKLADIPTTLTKQYEQHQDSLKSLNQAVEYAVREQQRLGLEMLQVSNASKQQFDAFSNRATQCADEVKDRETRILERLDILTVSSGRTSSDLSAKVKQLELILIGGVVLILLVSGLLHVV